MNSTANHTSIMEFQRPDSATSQSISVFGGPGGVLSAGIALPGQWQPATPPRCMCICPAKPVHKALSARQLVKSPAPCGGMTRAVRYKGRSTPAHTAIAWMTAPAAGPLLPRRTQNSSRHMMTKDPSISSNRDRNACTTTGGSSSRGSSTSATVCSSQPSKEAVWLLHTSIRAAYTCEPTSASLPCCVNRQLPDAAVLPSAQLSFCHPPDAAALA